MKILFAAPCSGVQGGMTRWTQHILEYYKQQEDAHIAITLLDMGRSEFININMPAWKRVLNSFGDYQKILKKFHSEIHQNSYDILHLSSSASISLIKDYIMISLARRKNIKTIIHFHFGRIPELAIKNNWEWKLIKKIAILTNQIVVLDNASYNTLKHNGFNNVTIISNPIAPNILDTIEQNYYLKRKHGTILFTGHVIKTKGVFELIEACSQIRNIKLKLIGRITDDIKSKIDLQYKGQDWIEITGEMEFNKVIKEMMTCDIFALPTYSEGFPNVILEAMATGCPIITTPVGAIPQILERDEQGEYGIFVEPQNSDMLKGAIVRLLHNEMLKKHLSINVKRRVTERYNIKIIFKQLKSLWESLYTA